MNNTEAMAALCADLNKVCGFAPVEGPYRPDIEYQWRAALTQPPFVYLAFLADQDPGKEPRDLVTPIREMIEENELFGLKIMKQEAPHIKMGSAKSDAQLASVQPYTLLYVSGEDFEQLQLKTECLCAQKHKMRKVIDHLLTFSSPFVMIIMRPPKGLIL